MAPRHKHRNGHESGPRESCEFINRTILHRISVPTDFVAASILAIGISFLGETDLVAKIVAMRAVNAPIIAFCTELRCERFCDDGILGDRGREIDHRGRM